MEWIEVKTKLPKKVRGTNSSEPLLITNGEKIMESCYFFGKHPRWCYEYTIHGITPTHWMPFPPLPKKTKIKDI